LELGRHGGTKSARVSGHATSSGMRKQLRKRQIKKDKEKKAERRRQQEQARGAKRS